MSCWAEANQHFCDPSEAFWLSKADRAVEIECGIVGLGNKSTKDLRLRAPTNTNIPEIESEEADETLEEVLAFEARRVWNNSVKRGSNSEDASDMGTSLSG